MFLIIYSRGTYTKSKSYYLDCVDGNTDVPIFSDTTKSTEEACSDWNDNYPSGILINKQWNKMWTFKQQHQQCCGWRWRSALVICLFLFVLFAVLRIRPRVCTRKVCALNGPSELSHICVRCDIWTYKLRNKKLVIILYFNPTSPKTYWEWEFLAQI